MTDLTPDLPSGVEAGAQEAEATGGTVAVVHNGVTYQVKPAEAWPGRILRYAREGSMDLILETVLGPDQWKAYDATDPTIPDYGVLFEAIAKATGFDQGESGASPSS